GIQPEPHREAALTVEVDLGNARQRLQLLLDDAVGEIADLELVVAIAEEREIDRGPGVRFDLPDHRLLDLVRKAAAGPADPVADVARGRIRRAVQIELDRDLAPLRAAAGGHQLDALDTGELLLQRLRHLSL